VTALGRRPLRLEAGAARLRAAAQGTGTSGGTRAIVALLGHTPLPKTGRHPKTAPCGRLSTTPAELKSLAPGRVSASRREGVRGLPRSLAPGPSPGTQPRPRNPAPRCGGITDPRRTDHQSYARTGTTHPPSRSTRTARALADARPRLPRPPLLPLPRPLRPQLPPVASTVHPPGSTPPPPIATHGLRPPAWIRLPPPRPRPHQHPPGLARPGFTWRVEEGSPRRKQRTPFLESPGGKRKTGRERDGGPLVS
jgi:hypothetical protein